MVGLRGALDWWLNLPHSALPYMAASTCGAFAPLVACAHLRVWEVGWRNVLVDLRGGLVRESRATWLAEARWGASPGLYR